MAPPILRYQSQLQEQQQEVPAAAPAASATPARSAESVDDLIGDILKTPAPKGGAEESDDAAPDDGEILEPEGDASDAGDADTEAADADADDDDADGESDAVVPLEDEEPEPSAAALKAARKALKDGDLDKAFELAFGKKPEQVQPDAKVWTQWRKANERKDAQIAAREQQASARVQQGETWVAQQRQQLQGAIDQLRPYDEIHQARVAFKQTGDPELLKQMLEKTAEMPYDEVQKIILTKTRRSPGERALQQQVQTLMQKLEETERKKAEEATQQTTQQVYQSDLTTIRGELKGEVLRVPNVAERVYKVLADTRAPTGLTMTIEEAGKRVLAAERRRLAEHPLLKKPAKPNPAVSAAASTLAKAKKKTATSPALRRDSRGNGATDEKTETVDDILGDILGSKNRRRTM